MRNEATYSRIPYAETRQCFQKIRACYFGGNIKGVPHFPIGGKFMKIRLSDHFHYKTLLKFVFPSVCMMVFSSIYGVVDGLFVSNFAGETPFAAINLLMPFFMILGAVGFMIGAGGSAVVSRTFGEGENEKACSYFTFLVLFTAIAGTVLAVLGELVLPAVARLFKATDDLYVHGVDYGRIILIGIPFWMLQTMFQTFFVTAEKSRLGFIVTVISGVTNMVGDALLVGVCDFGVKGAAWATILSQFVGAVIPVVFFACKNSSLLRFTKTKFYGKILFETCSNGSSEFVSNVSSSIVGILFNYRLLALAGESGVSAYGVLMYVNFIYVAILLGYSIGVAPVIGYHYGAKNHGELKSLFKKSLVLTGVTDLILTVLAEILAAPLSYLFVGKNPELYSLTRNAFYLYSLCFLFTGFNIFGSAFFTALSNGKVSAAISFLRTVVFQVAAVLTLPELMHGINGVWLSVVVAEVLSFIVTVVCFIRYRKRYGYA